MASAVESHYDNQANVNIGRGRFIKQRLAGPLIKYKEFANNVKRRMFKQYAAGAPLLLDLGCGRGGDISKWRDAGVGRVLAMDLSADQLLEARKREQSGGGHSSGKGKGKGKGRAGHGTVIEWMQGSLLDAMLEPTLRKVLSSTWQMGSADAVSIMFAVQFAFVSSQMADALMRTVARLLRPGGIFFGTAPDGDAIETAVGSARKIHLKPPEHQFALLLQLLPPEAAAEGADGQPLIFSLEDTVTSGTDDSGCIEYLCRRNALVRLAASYGLEEVTRPNSHAPGCRTAPP